MSSPTPGPVHNPARELLRHTLATLAYRGGKALRGAPEPFAQFRAGEKTRTPGEILAHIGDLLDWALSICKGAEQWHNSTPSSWGADAARFHRAIESLDNYLASSEKLPVEPERLFQGAIADSLTHIGQIAMLRRLAGCPIRAENYFRADIVKGRVGHEQTPPKREFD